MKPKPARTRRKLPGTPHPAAVRRLDEAFRDLRSRWTRALNVTPAQPLIRHALGEAEAIAWQTPFPLLVYPLLAEEKVRHAQRWLRRQSDLLERSPESSFAE